MNGCVPLLGHPGMEVWGGHPNDRRHCPGERIHCGSQMPWKELASQQPQSQLAEWDHSIVSDLVQMLSGEVIKVTIIILVSNPKPINVSHINARCEYNSHSQVLYYLENRMTQQCLPKDQPMPGGYLPTLVEWPPFPAPKNAVLQGEREKTSFEPSTSFSGSLTYLNLYNIQKSF